MCQILFACTVKMASLGIRSAPGAALKESGTMQLMGMAEEQICELLAKINRDRAARNITRTYVNVGF